MNKQDFNRRDFIKTAGAFVALAGIAPTAIIEGPAEPVIGYHTKEWWKRYFRENTQEKNLMFPVEKTKEALAEYHEKFKKRYSEGAYIQLSDTNNNAHTDNQIDALPDGKGTYLIFRLKHRETKTDEDGMPEITIELTSTAIQVV